MCNGVTVSDKKYNIKLKAIICDAPARAFVAYIKGHSGYFGCGKCTQEGEFIKNRICFPNLNSPIRTDTSFRCRLQEDHHTGTSILESIDFGMVSQIPFEYMHLVCLGVVRKIFNLWMKGDLKYRIPQSSINKLSEAFMGLAPCISIEFARKPRSLKELDKFKATEFRQILLYTGPIALSSLPKHLFDNFMILHCAITILCAPQIRDNSIYDYANDLLKNFVHNFTVIYGKENVSYNVHGLLHLVNDVKSFGCLDNFSAFAFENFMQKIKKTLRKSEKPLEQFHLRMAEAMLYSCNVFHHQFSLCREHNNGPLLSLCGMQYEKAVFPNFILTIKSPNNVCCLNDGSIVIIFNFLKVQTDHTTDLVIIGKKFLNLSDLYEKPCKSSLLGIVKSSEFSPMSSWPLNNIRKKCISFQMSNSFAIFPILHSKFN